MRFALRVGALAILTLPALTRGARQTEAHLPKVISASVPFYPQLAPTARIEGIVKLDVSTDGKRVSAVEAQSGPPMLVLAAKENVKTWQFEPHTPATFALTFQYKLLLPHCASECHCDGAEMESVLLQLPTNITLSSRIPPICDPAVNVGEKPTAAQVKPLDSKESILKAVSAALPFYPPLAQQTRIQGMVTLRVSTDGKGVSAVEAESGHRLLVDAATENVKTWQFAPHAPTTFETAFHYRLLDVKCDSQCKCESLENEAVVLQLPSSIEVSAPGIMLCDPAVETGRKKSIFARLLHLR